MTPEFITFVEQRFIVQMTAQYPSMSLYFSNVPVSDDLGAFAVIHVIPSEDVIPLQLGINSSSRNVGLVQVDVFTPKDTGAGVGQDIAQFAGKVFKRQVLAVVSEGTVTFKDHVVQDRGEVRGRHKEQMRIPYRYDFKD